MKEYQLGQIAGLKLSATPAAMVASALLLILLSGLAITFLHLSVGEAITGSLLAVILHWLSEIAHHVGHAWAAGRAGYPMIGVRLGMLGLFGASLYPTNEPTLPGKVHIRRALGGPAGSLFVSFITGLIALALRATGGILWWLALFCFMDNLFVLTLGALLPLGFNDGSTLLRWWGKP